MNISTLNNTISNINKFLFGLMIFSIVLKSSTITQYITIDFITPLFKVGIIICSSIIIFSKEVTVKTILSWLLALFVVIVSVIQTRDFNYLLYILLILSIKETDYKEYVKIALLTMSLGIVLVLILWSMAIIPDNILFRSGVIRHSLGFKLPVTLPSFYLSIYSMVFIVVSEKKKMKWLLLLQVPSLIIYKICDGRTSFYGTVLILVLFIIYKGLSTDNSKEKMMIYLKRCIYVTCILLFILTLYVANNYTNQNLLISMLDKAMTGRIYWWNKYLNEYQFTLFGQKLLRVSSTARLTNSNSKIMILDSSYLSLMLEQGILLTIVIVIAFKKLISILVKKRDAISLILWLTFLILGFFGNSLLFLETNILIIQFSFLIKINSSVVVEEKNLNRLLQI